MPFGFLVVMTLMGVLGWDNVCPVDASNFSETLIGGQIVNHTAFPELIYLRNSDGAQCSGAIVGPRVILTAAHCVSEDGHAYNTFNGPGFIKFDIHCEQDPKYILGDEGLDFALCKSTQGKIVGAIPATIGTRGVRHDEEVILTGYGCTNSGGDGGNNGPLKWGMAKVFALPQGAVDWFYTKADNAALCFGDSGGPAFRMMNPLYDRHVIVGVNSRGNIRDISLLTALYIKKSQTFLENWARRNHVGICGVNLKCKVGTYSFDDDDV